MNSCILMAEIVQDPQLRYTAENQTPIAEMLVKFSNGREDSFATLKVVGWGNLAQEISQKYHPGDQVILEGRLRMSMIERPEGFKEKRAELTVQKIYPVGMSSASQTPSAPNNVVPLSVRNRTSTSSSPMDDLSSSEPMQPSSPASETTPLSSDDPDSPDFDPIPF